MVRRFWSLVYLLGRAATYALGLLVLAGLLLGPAAVGLAAVGDPLTLGGRNDAVDRVTSLAAAVAGPVLRLTNLGAGPALDLRVQAGAPPLRVNSDGLVANLNADRLDGLDASAFQPALAWAHVNAAGTVLDGNGVVSVTLGGGGYFVRFDRDVSRCAYLATVGEPGTAYFDPGEAQAIHSTGAGDPTRDVYVAFSDNDTGAVPRGFSLVVVC